MYIYTLLTCLKLFCIVYISAGVTANAIIYCYGKVLEKEYYGRRNLSLEVV